MIAAPDEGTILHVLRTRPIAALVIEPAIFAGRHQERLAAIGCVCAERGIPLVICSTLDERRLGIELGVAAYLIKPTLPSTLFDTLQQICGSGRN